MIIFTIRNEVAYQEKIVDERIHAGMNCHMLCSAMQQQFAYGMQQGNLTRIS